MLDINTIRADWTPEHEWETVNESRTILSLCDEVERLRVSLFAVIDGVKHADYRESEIVKLAENGLYGNGGDTQCTP